MGRRFSYKFHRSNINVLNKYNNNFYDNYRKTKNHRHREIYEGCGETKSCFGMPVGCVQDKSCNVIVSYELNGDKMLFKLLGFPYHDNLPGGSEGYLSLGLSPGDPYMGNDLTTTCYYDQA